jgi:hypothetical protein
MRTLIYMLVSVVFKRRGKYPAAWRSRHNIGWLTCISLLVGVGALAQGTLSFKLNPASTDPVNGGNQAYFTFLDTSSVYAQFQWDGGANITVSGDLNGGVGGDVLVLGSAVDGVTLVSDSGGQMQLAFNSADWSGIHASSGSGFVFNTDDSGDTMSGPVAPFVNNSLLTVDTSIDGGGNFTGGYTVGPLATPEPSIDFLVPLGFLAWCSMASTRRSRSGLVS